jgi:hypothetical protein
MYAPTIDQYHELAKELITLHRYLLTTDDEHVVVLLLNPKTGEVRSKTQMCARIWPGPVQFEAYMRRFLPLLDGRI